MQSFEFSDSKQHFLYGKYLVSKSGALVSATTALNGKEIGLYFAGEWLLFY
jgi:hypothetical protein